MYSIRHHMVPTSSRNCWRRIAHPSSKYVYANDCFSSSCFCYSMKGLQNSLAWHKTVFGKLAFVFANATYDPIRTVLIDICHDNEIRSVLLEELF